MALALLAAPGVPGARAQEPREVTISRQSGFAVSLVALAGSSGGSATKIIGRDLAAANSFKLVEPGSAGSFRVSGTSSGGRIDGALHAPDGSEVFARTYGGSSLKANAHRFADDVVEAITGRPGIASGTIAFVSNQSGHKEIYLCDSDGDNIRRVTSDQSLCVAPSISTDGSYLVHTGYQSGYADVYFVDLVTGGRHRIIDAPGTNSGAAIAPDARRIALTMSFTGNTELYLTSLGGGRAKRLTHTAGVEASPTWSPDGRELIYSSSQGGSGPMLFRISSSGGTPQPVPTGFRHCTEPDWSPDGRRVAFNALSGTQKIAVLDLTSGRTTILGPGENASWGADSRHLVYADGGSLILHDVDGGTTATLVSGAGRISEPSWTR